MCFILNIEHLHKIYRNDFLLQQGDVDIFLSQFVVCMHLFLVRIDLSNFWMEILNMAEV